jgi:hypothetical protein
VQAGPGKEGHRYAVCRNDASHIIEETIPELPLDSEDVTDSDDSSASAAETSEAEELSVSVVQNENNYPTSFNALDYILSISDIVLAVIIARHLKINIGIINWDRKLRRKNISNK